MKNCDTAAIFEKVVSMKNKMVLLNTITMYIKK